MRKLKIRQIALALRLSFSSHRDILQGISRQAKTLHWQLHFVSTPDSHAHEKLPMRELGKIDGLITCENMPDQIPDHHPGAKFPIVLVCTRHRSLAANGHPLGFVDIDDAGIGKMGAKHLQSCGQFRSYGFVPENHNNHCSERRCAGFIQQLKSKCTNLSVYPRQHSADGSAADKRALSEWLSALPKPAGIMAAYDLRATQVVEAAQAAGIDIPKDVSIIGVDNDNLLCDFTNPPLTSIAPDFVLAGELAAKTLHRLMSEKTVPRSLRATSTVKKVVERASTRQLSPAVSLVERALAFIRGNALSGINASDVVQELNVSRRLADRRFREVMKSSILESIIDIRLDAIKDKLEHTDMPIGKISAICGFKNENYAKNLFKKRFKVSMRAFRALSGQKRRQ